MRNNLNGHVFGLTSETFWRSDRPRCYPACTGVDGERSAAGAKLAIDLPRDSRYVGPMDDRVRAELIGAVVQLTTAIEQILALTERLLGMSGDARGFSAQELTDARAQLALSRQQVDALTLHVALTLPPPDRPQ